MKVKSTRIYVNEVFKPAVITILNNKITAINYDMDTISDFDYGNLRIIPGMIDIHCHGYDLFDSSRATSSGLIKWKEQLPLEGVTSFLASSSTAPESDLIASFKVISDVIKNNHSGANCLGIHVEGPHIGFKYRGAQDPYNIQVPCVEQFKRWQISAQDYIKLICVAPEMDNNMSLTEYCSANNVCVSIGHSGATYEVATEAINKGARSFTHTFNGMCQLGHRSPNVVGAALSDDRCYAELICDGIHVHPCACKILATCKGKDKLIIITDSTIVKGLAPGKHSVNTREVEIFADGSARLADGTLAGSTNALNKSLKIAIEDMHIDEITAINAVTANPASLLKLQSKGFILEGMDADIVVLNDDYSVNDVFISGQKYIGK